MAADPRCAVPLLRLADVKLTYPGGTRALAGIDLEVAPGEFLAIVGPSGCGKSTLLRLIAGLAAPTAGCLAWSAPPTAGDIGFVFQETTLMPWARLAANVRLPLDLRGIPRREADRRVAAQLERVGLADFARAYPRELSGGMKMRASLARALVTEPRILLLDEPFAALDEITRFKLNDDLRMLWEATGVTAVFVTHCVFESAYLAGRVVVMSPRPGRIVAEIEPGFTERAPDLRTSAEFGAACRHISAALATAMGGGA